MSYATSDVITWAKGSQPLAELGEAKKKALTGGSIDPDLARKIYVERKSLEWQLEQDPSDADGILVGQTNYVYDLCFPYMLEAQYNSGGGGLVIDPTTPTLGDIYPFVITSGNFEADGKSYNNADIVGDEIMLFINEWTQQWLFAPGAFTYTSTGFTINNGAGEQMEGFNANTGSYTIIVQKRNNG